MVISSRNGVRLLVVLLSLYLGGVAQAAEEQKPRVLLAKHLDLDLPDIKIKGKISLYSLAPLSGKLEIQEADGDPRRIFELISESTGLLHGLSTQLPIKQLNLKGFVLTMTKQGLAFKFSKAVIPEGFLEQVVGEVRTDKLWSIRSGKLYLTDFPVPEQKWRMGRMQINPFPLGYASLVAHGEEKKGEVTLQKLFTQGVKSTHLKVWAEQLKKDGRVDLSLEGEGVTVADPGRYPDQTGLVKNILAYAGKGSKPSIPLMFDRVVARGVASPGNLHINPLRLSARDLQVWGEVVGKKPQMEIKLTAKSPGKEAQSFRWKTEGKPR
ncbi:MAG: hypothetical protein HQL72_15655 [Magnetococcales bacterium]|nr:hypothetical protein [Magnetococcales bacterium]